MQAYSKPLSPKLATRGSPRTDPRTWQTCPAPLAGASRPTPQESNRRNPNGGCEPCALLKWHRPGDDLPPAWPWRQKEPV